MSSFFEQELEKMFGDGEVIQSPQFTGRACVGNVSENARAHISFTTTGVADRYDGLLIKILNKQQGEVDRCVIRFQDALGRKPVPNNPNFRDGVIPHIWIDRGKAEWYAYRPNAADYQKLRQESEKFISVFRDQQRDGPKMVYICAPLRGDVEKNIEFARQKAKEVFQSGDIPVCPHLMFPPIADPNDPKQDLSAREMGLRLIESCQQIAVFGSEWTEGMWTEINHAMKHNIPVMTDQKTIGRPPQRTNKRRKPER